MKSVGNKANIKNQKKLDREKKRQIQQANKMLIPVSKKTRNSMGMISYDPEGILRLTNQRWLKVFEADGDVSNLMNIVETLSGRIRMTMHLRSRCGGETCHISLMHIGETYEEVRENMKSDEMILRKVVSLTPLTAEQVMNQVSQDLKKKEQYESCFSILSYPLSITENVIAQLRRLGCGCYLACDLQGLTQEDKENFTRAMEKNYNQRMLKLGEEQYCNVSFSFLVLCDSEDAKQIVEQTMVSWFARQELLLVASYGKQKQTEESILSLGVFDEKTMRNVNLEVIRNMLGGMENANAKIKV